MLSSEEDVFMIPIVTAAILVPSTDAVWSLPTGASESPWRTFVEGGAIHQFDADLDGGGSYSVTRASIEASMRRAFSERINAFASPSVRWSAESCGDAGEAMTAGLLDGANHRVSDRLTIGPGIGVFDEFGDSDSAFPIMLIDWRITDTLSLATGGKLRLEDQRDKVIQTDDADPLGTAYGCSFANIALMLGATTLISPIGLHSQVLRKEPPVLGDHQPFVNRLAKVDRLLLKVDRG